MRSPGLAGLSIALAFALVTTGCMPVMAPVGGEAPVEARPMPVGPQLILEIVNNTPRELSVEYEFDALNAGGGGGGAWPGCEHMSVVFGDVAGVYAIIVDGEEVIDGSVPGGMASGFLVHRVVVHPDGRIDADPARWSGVEPAPISRDIGGCG